MKINFLWSFDVALVGVLFYGTGFLLKNKLNAAIQNQTWNIKLNGNKKVKHFIKNNADLLINKELIDKEDWNENTIEKRTEILTKEFFEIWNIDIFENK